jgi:NADH-quinone oxidoreductase subunit C
MQFKDICSLLQSKFGAAILDCKEELPSDPFVKIAADKLTDICLFLRDDENTQFDYLNLLGGMDLGENLGVVYHLYSMKFSHKFVMKLSVPKDDPKVPTVERVWRSADWHEREAYDMYGIEFVGHHNLIRILNPYDWEGYPLRKDYKTPEEYHGMKVPY